jgi:cell division protein FtsB
VKFFFSALLGLSVIFPFRAFAGSKGYTDVSLSPEQREQLKIEQAQKQAAWESEQELLYKTDPVRCYKRTLITKRCKGLAEITADRVDVEARIREMQNPTHTTTLWTAPSAIDPLSHPVTVVTP